MCSVFFTSSINLSLDKLLALSNLMQHRGPDGQGYYYDNDNACFMGHNRLAVMDLSERASQPFYSRSKMHLIIYNGEVYNFRELAKQYNIILQTSCDTELIIELYEKIGERMLTQLNGMFVFIILNLKTKSIFIARDKLGIKPLYYYQSNHSLSIASEIAPLLEIAGSAEVDEIGVRQYKKLRTFFNGRTLYKKIKSFPAAHYYKDGTFTRYWSVPLFDDSYLEPNDHELAELLKSAVGYCCIADVPMGAFLSGGLDSSLVTMLAKPTHTWSVGFPADNEFSWAKIIADASQSCHHDVVVDTELFLSTARDLIQKSKNPLSVPNEVLLYLMSEQAKQKNKVILCGEGADELFFGYDRIFRWAHGKSHFNIEEFDRGYSYSQNSDIEILEDILHPFIKRSFKPIDTVANFFLESHLHGLLKRVDASTMRASIEARVPFLDTRLVEMLPKLSFNYKIFQGLAKAPLKRISQYLLPQEIIKREKVGFSVPLEKIFNTTDRHAAFDAWIDFNLTCLEIEAFDYSKGKL